MAPHTQMVAVQKHEGNLQMDLRLRYTGAKPHANPPPPSSLFHWLVLDSEEQVDATCHRALQLCPAAF